MEKEITEQTPDRTSESASGEIVRPAGDESQMTEAPAEQEREHSQAGVKSDTNEAASSEAVAESTSEDSAAGDEAEQARRAAFQATIKSAVEAIVYVAEEPVTVEQIGAAVSACGM